MDLVSSLWLVSSLRPRVFRFWEQDEEKRNPRLVQVDADFVGSAHVSENEGRLMCRRQGEGGAVGGWGQTFTLLIFSVLL